MPTLLPAIISEKSSTSSHSDEDWYSGLFEGGGLIQLGQFHLPDCDTINGIVGWRWSPDKIETASVGETKYPKSLEIIEEIESPLIPPNKKFQVKLLIKTVRKGKPSVCDEIEQ